jgi:hypothetical protein
MPVLRVLRVQHTLLVLHTLRVLRVWHTNVHLVCLPHFLLL